MGADFFVTSIAFACGKNDAEQAANVKSELAEGRRRLKKASADDLEDYFAWIGCDKISSAALRKAKTDLGKDLAELEDLAINGGREVGWLPGGRGIAIFCTGGMSWGEEPTQAYELFNRIISAGLIQDLRHPHRLRPCNGITIVFPP